MFLAAGNGELPHTALVRKVRQGIRQRHHLEPISFLLSKYTAWELTIKVARYHMMSGTFTSQLAQLLLRYFDTE